jgi:glycosyltransferase involved in cell wall biosynthesis
VSDGPSVLLVAGAYFPEISAAGLQCQAVAAALRGRATMSVIATAVDGTLPANDVVDGVAVTRVIVDVRSAFSKIVASVRLVTALAARLWQVDVVHVHGFSQKNLPAALAAALFRRPIVLSLHTAGQDEPGVIDRRGALAGWSLRRARLILAVSPNLLRRCEEAGLPHLRLTPNGVDLERFRPATAVERARIRRDLGWSDSDRVILFVGFFSRDKRPDLLFRAWTQMTSQGVAAKLVYVGATASTYFEIDRSLAENIRAQALALGRQQDVLFVDPTHAMERYYRAADLFVLSSIREAHPMALLEAMACGLPCVASRIEGATDVIISDGVNGRLVECDDEQGLTNALTQVLCNAEEARRLGQAARLTIAGRYDIRQTAECWLDAYRSVLP